MSPPACSWPPAAVVMQLGKFGHRVVFGQPQSRQGSVPFCHSTECLSTERLCITRPVGESTTGPDEDEEVPSSLTKEVSAEVIHGRGLGCGIYWRNHWRNTRSRIPVYVSRLITWRSRYHAPNAAAAVSPPMRGAECHSAGVVQWW